MKTERSNKSHHPRPDMLDQHKVDALGAHARKSDAQTPGQYQRDPHNRRGQYTSAGSSGLMKK